MEGAFEPARKALGAYRKGLSDSLERNHLMWRCVKCHADVDEEFDACWQCGTSRDGIEDPTFTVADVLEQDVEDFVTGEGISETDPTEVNPMVCPRCFQPLDYVGSKAFHEGTRWGIMGDLGELFVNRTRFDVYCCPRCGRVEFFINGVGEEFRPH